MPESSKQVPKKRITRSRQGCLTCRSRHKACDLARPQCSACTRLGRECVWPTIKAYTPRKSATKSSTAGAPPKSSITFPAVSAPAIAPTPQPHHHNSLSSSVSSVLAPDYALTLPVSLLNPHQSIYPSFSSLPIPLVSDSVQNDLFTHYHSTLGPLISCARARSSADPIGFAAIASYALSQQHQASDGASSILLMSIMAWSARHLTNRNITFYREASEILVQYSITLLSQQLPNIIRDALAFSVSDNAISNPLGMYAYKDNYQNVTAPSPAPEQLRAFASDPHRLLTFFTVLSMLMHFKIGRGDVCGFSPVVQHCRTLAKALSKEFQRSSPGDVPHYLFENVVYHQTVSNLPWRCGLIIDNPQSYVHATASSGSFVHTLSGLAFPVILIISEANQLILRYRDVIKGETDDCDNEEELVEIQRQASAIEAKVHEEHRRLQTVVSQQPDLVQHAPLHDVFCIATILFVRANIMCESAYSVSTRVLAKQGLELLERISQEELPGFCSLHWPLFVIGISTLDKKLSSTEIEPVLTSPLVNDFDVSAMFNDPLSVSSSVRTKKTDRGRIKEIYSKYSRDFGLLNVERSKRLMEHVWSIDDGGKICVDWISVLEDWQWELLLV